MHPYYRDYCWQNGVPRGCGRVPDTDLSLHAVAYRIIDDPYRKRFSVERYRDGLFDVIAYDSQLLDFRKLKPVEQQGWQRQVLETSGDATVCLIRNQEERVLYVERMRFDGTRCRECQLSTPQGVVLSIHRMFYRDLGDGFDGILLHDANDHCVLAKRYAIGLTGEFSELLEERWDLQDSSFLARWQASAQGATASP